MPDASVGRIWLPDEYRDSKKQGQLGPNAGAPLEALCLVYAQERKTSRRPKVAAAFFEPNSHHIGKEALITLGCGHSPL